MPVTETQTTEKPSMKRSAKNIVITFNTHTPASRCTSAMLPAQANRAFYFRSVLGKALEALHTDALGVAVWVPYNPDTHGPAPSEQTIVEAALRKVFADLPPFVNATQLYPTGVCALGGAIDTIEINLGTVSADLK